MERLRDSERGERRHDRTLFGRFDVQDFFKRKSPKEAIERLNDPLRFLCLES